MDIKTSNYNKPRSAFIKKMMLAIKSFLLTISVSQYIGENQELAFWLLVGGALLDELSQFIGETKSE